ncbi:MAG: DNRLRE domain-containing protein [Prosthecobacter sp.]|jgi:ferric-dicitrate binding protein FerR (iron transport regulator)|nr:DNRLRE domain-containing protein [Prosthecobacter sp.]
MKPAEQWQLLELWERARSGASSPEETAELNRKILEDAEARQVLARAAWMDAEMQHLDAKDLAQPAIAQAHRPRASSWRWHVATAALAALLAVGFFSLLSQGPAPAATLVKARNCKWGSSALPTLEGSSLMPGTMELLEGMATLRFESGAEVTLEAPVSLEVLSAMECRVKRGTVVADVPPQAKGFTIVTPETRVVDWGTRFGVSAGEDGKCLVHVIEGLVEVQRQGEKSARELRSGQRVDYGNFLAGAVNPDALREDQPEPGRWLPGPVRDLGDGWQAITTAYGAGKDTWIQSSTVKATGRESFLRVKHSSHDAKLDRKAYIAFDLTRFQGREILEAELDLHIEPSELGFASLVPDATFTVHALTDESLDLWPEDGLTWENAPAHDGSLEGRTTPIASQADKVGEFIVPQGTTRGVFSLKGEALTHALRADTNGIITFILTRQTDEMARNGLAHAFASRENTKNTPPTLRVKLKESPE